MKTKFTKVIWLLLENIPSILTVGFAAYVLLLSQTKRLESEQISLWMLAILGLLAISELVERFRRLERIEDYAQKTLDIIEKREGKPTAESFFRTLDDLPPLPARIRQAREIWFAGRSLNSVIGNYRTLFEKKAITEGCCFRFLVVDPEGTIAEAETTSPCGDTSLTMFKLNSQKTMTNLKALRDLAGDKLVEVRVLDYAPRFSLLIIDGDRPHGKAQVQLYPFRTSSWERPIFQLTASANGKWYKMFYDQFLQLWDIAKPWQA